MRIEHISPKIGSEIHDLDLRDAARLSEHGNVLKKLLADRQVIFFRDQELTPAEQVKVAQIFGKVEPVSSTFPSHPENPNTEVLVSKGTSTGTDIWHADLTWLKTPAAGACLFAVDVPEVGGDTMWSSMTAAYDSLDQDLRNRLAKLSAVHNWEAPALRENVLARDPSGAMYRDIRAKHPPLEHPVIYPHPVTGKPVVFINALYTTSIRGLNYDESTSLIAYLSNLAKVPEWQVRFKWRKGSVAIWDNVATQHYAINDYHPYARRMHRVAFRSG